MLSEFERRAWDSRNSAERHKPEMALKATLDQLERGELKARHVAIVVVEDIGEQRDCIHLIQAGDLSELAVEGALNRAIIVQASSLK